MDSIDTFGKYPAIVDISTTDFLRFVYGFSVGWCGGGTKYCNSLTFQYPITGFDSL